MRTVRIWLLVLIAVLLPVRGAVAAAMLCPMGVEHAPVASAEHRHDDRAVAADHHDHTDHEHRGLQAHDHDHGSSADKCNLCVAFCSITPLLSELPTVPAPQEVTTLRFPSYAAAPPSFFSDGEERPPRSI